MEFDALFQELAGIDPDKATVKEDYGLFVPYSDGFNGTCPEKRARLAHLAGGHWWQSAVLDMFAEPGIWIKRPA